MVSFRLLSDSVRLPLVSVIVSILPLPQAACYNLQAPCDKMVAAERRLVDPPPAIQNQVPDCIGDVFCF